MSLGKMRPLCPRLLSSDKVHGISDIQGTPLGYGIISKANVLSGGQRVDLDVVIPPLRLLDYLGIKP